MNDVDWRCQQIVDDLAAGLLDRTAADLLGYPAYGTVRRSLNGRAVDVGWWHYGPEGGTHQIVFKLTRSLALSLHRSYVSGVVVGPGTPPRLMTAEEAGDHD